jgi:glycosyltransferase involved in cell wall biosynthesis
VAVIEPSAQGGLLHYAVQLADALAACGHEVDALVPSGNELLTHEGPARMRSILTPPTPPPGYRLEGVGVIRRGRVGIRMLRAWWRIARELRTHRYDAAILTSDIDLWPIAAAALLITLRRGNMRIAGVCHSVRPFNRWSGRNLFLSAPVLDRLLRVLYPRLEVLFVHGENSRREFEATWPRSNLVVIPHGDERIFGTQPPPPASEERALFFGEWRKVKGLTVLMEAFDILAKRRSGARMTIAGSPCPVDLDPDEIRRWAAAHDGRVEIIDRYVPVAEVPHVFAAARAVVTPYLVGYQSGVVHIAMTMARAVVSSAVGDLTSVVVDGETGLTVTPGDAHALAGALEVVLADRGLAERLGAEGHRRLLENSSWETVARRVTESLLAPR